jgi:hypothetical protein
MFERELEQQLREAARNLLLLRGVSDSEAAMLCDIIYGELGSLEEGEW